ncbi:MAG: TolC family protein [Gammaproteobacteria bacterium]|nr:TolC family protein [Gammaproteobacteria bacterium]
MRRRKALPGVVVGCCVAAVLAAASLEAQEPRVLSLEDALELAAQNSPALRQVMNELELTAAGMRAAWGAFLPTLSLSLGTNINVNRRLQAEDNFGNPIANPNVEWVTVSSSSQSMSAQMDLFEGGARFHERGAERARGIARERGVEAEMTATWARVATSFYETIRQSDLLELEMAILEGKRLDQESTTRLFELAVGSRVDVLAAELEVQRQERAVRQAENEHAKAVLALRAETGATDEDNFTTSGTLPEPFDPAALDETGVIGRALEQSPLIRQNRAQVDVGRASLSAVRSTRLPTISLGTFFFQDQFGQAYTAAFKPFSSDARYASARLSLSIPVFSGFSNERNITQAQVELANAEEQMRQTRLEIERDVRSRLIDLRGAWDSYRLAERSSEIAEERLRLAREGYRLTTVPFSDLQLATEGAANERRTAINARYDFVAARIALEQVVGGPLDGGTPLP